MNRRGVRLRREFLYRKSIEAEESAKYESKKKIKIAMEEGKKIPTELRNQSKQLLEEIKSEDVKTSEFTSVFDDEYNASQEIPAVLLTTSRDPSTRLVQFAKEFRLCIPNSRRLNRGNAKVPELLDLCRSNQLSDLVIIHEHRGEPDGLIISHLPYGPTAYFGLKNVVLRHDLNISLGNISESYPHLLFEQFNEFIGKRLKTILTALFPIPKMDSSRILSFINRDDLISFRHYNYKQIDHKNVELAEVGPRFEMNLYQIKLGTVEMKEAEDEYVLRPFMNSAKKRKVI
jgi:U3 small nucleolar ribonucleoprotein protein IMP4